VCEGQNGRKRTSEEKREGGKGRRTEREGQGNGETRGKEKHVGGSSLTTLTLFTQERKR
jgi:hypothetical protein